MAQVGHREIKSFYAVIEAFMIWGQKIVSSLALPFSYKKHQARRGEAKENNGMSELLRNEIVLCLY